MNEKWPQKNTQAKAERVLADFFSNPDSDILDLHHDTYKEVKKYVEKMPDGKTKGEIYNKTIVRWEDSQRRLNNSVEKQEKEKISFSRIFTNIFADEKLRNALINKGGHIKDKNDIKTLRRAITIAEKNKVLDEDAITEAREYINNSAEKMKENELKKIEVIDREEKDAIKIQVKLEDGQSGKNTISPKEWNKKQNMIEVNNTSPDTAEDRKKFLEALDKRLVVLKQEAIEKIISECKNFQELPEETQRAFMEALEELKRQGVSPSKEAQKFIKENSEDIQDFGKNTDNENTSKKKNSFTSKIASIFNRHHVLGKIVKGGAITAGFFSGLFALFVSLPFIPAIKHAFDEVKKAWKEASWDNVFPK